MEPLEPERETTEVPHKHPPVYQPDALTREGMMYLVNVRTVLWVIVLALLLAFMTWWVVT
jgi:hypothetical protein